MAPEDLGMQRADYADIAPVGNLREEALRFVRVVAGKGSEACMDFTALNAGAIFYLVGAVKDLKSGVAKAYEMIHSGKALEKLGAWVLAQNTSQGVTAGEARFHSLLKDAAVSLR
jgi:anthranilate phosphoribosyltransferase